MTSLSNTVLRIVCVMAIVNLATALAMAESLETLASSAEKVLTTHCYRCHGQNNSSQGGFDHVTDLAKLVESEMVIPGDPVKSRIYKRMNPDLVGDMPADDLTTPTADEIESIRTWIAAGAPRNRQAETEVDRPFFTLAEEVAAMDHFLQEEVSSDQWTSYRFFSLRNLYNMPRRRVKDEDLNLYKAALSKLINSLSWHAKIIHPRSADSQGIVLAVDVRQLGWIEPDGKNLWDEILAKYPYGLTHGRYPEEPTINRQWKQVTERTRSSLPVLRTDWFIALAARPPLYHTLVQIPEQLAALQQRIPTESGTLDLFQNIIDGRVQRAGFNGSGVSDRNNRLIERHDTQYGAFWISYDMKVSAGRGNLFVFPLGPKFAENPFDKQAFVHDGGEVIFNLPNGLQAYMLVDNLGRRIDEGPIAIVSDGNEKRSGTPAIVNGISCMACHQYGMIRKSDEIRGSHVLGGAAKDRIDQIYVLPEQLDAVFQQDEERFERAANEAVRPFLLTGSDAEKTIRDFPEPIAPIAKWYVVPELSLADVTRELGVSDAEKVREVIAGNEELMRHGLFPLTRGNTIKREVWESQEFLFSAFQRCAQKLKLGEPIANQ